MERIKKWSGTIEAQRRQRIQAQAEKAKLQEDERQKIDQAWALVKDQEKKEAIARARNIQYNQEPRVRDLNSKLALYNVLQVFIHQD
jgi:hypothetical protein